ncbi:(2Fe-2S) ferredoxin domain-containing protein [Deinococcus sp. S9]|uniref:(2Fe-2S) ferredoxin domain-containing protein n=1 Tax=Deinococcus sp. S9 TaxID=2545754 RepID=UPI00105600CD|nr:NAD(P)H-dependent oxidoreductase subunit E [Deinococcus sp. S9]TDE86517.1 (2Fe-2S) ferredoxin domain-containing protein [Deinococcus sp. S9]
MPPKFFPTRGHLLVCQGQNCQARGSALLYKALWNHLERAALAYYKQGGSVRLTESGCLGACSFGPALCVYRHRGGELEEGWYAAADFPLTAKVAQAVHEEAPLPEDRKYGP